jgi:hypothetical protein
MTQAVYQLGLTGNYNSVENPARAASITPVKARRPSSNRTRSPGSGCSRHRYIDGQSMCPTARADSGTPLAPAGPSAERLQGESISEPVRTHRMPMCPDRWWMRCRGTTRGRFSRTEPGACRQLRLEVTCGHGNADTGQPPVARRSLSITSVSSAMLWMRSVPHPLTLETWRFQRDLCRCRLPRPTDSKSVGDEGTERRLTSAITRGGV